MNLDDLVASDSSDSEQGPQPDVIVRPARMGWPPLQGSGDLLNDSDASDGLNFLLNDVKDQPFVNSPSSQSSSHRQQGTSWQVSSNSNTASHGHAASAWDDIAVGLPDGSAIEEEYEEGEEPKSTVQQDATEPPGRVPLSTTATASAYATDLEELESIVNDDPQSSTVPHVAAASAHQTPKETDDSAVARKEVSAANHRKGKGRFAMRSGVTEEEDDDNDDGDDDDDMRPMLSHFKPPRTAPSIISSPQRPMSNRLKRPVSRMMDPESSGEVERAENEIGDDHQSFGELQIVELKASDLMQHIPDKMCDPFVVFSLGDIEHRTDVTMSQRNPTWNENISLHVSNPYEVVVARVYHWDRTGDPLFLGGCAIPLNGLPENSTFEMSKELKTEMEIKSFLNKEMEYVSGLLSSSNNHNDVEEEQGLWEEAIESMKALADSWRDSIQSTFSTSSIGGTLSLTIKYAVSKDAVRVVVKSPDGTTTTCRAEPWLSAAKLRDAVCSELSLPSPKMYGIALVEVERDTSLPRLTVILCEEDSVLKSLQNMTFAVNRRSWLSSVIRRHRRVVRSRVEIQLRRVIFPPKIPLDSQEVDFLYDQTAVELVSGSLRKSVEDTVSLIALQCKIQKVKDVHKMTDFVETFVPSRLAMEGESIKAQVKERMKSLAGTVDDCKMQFLKLSWDSLGQFFQFKVFLASPGPLPYLSRNPLSRKYKNVVVTVNHNGLSFVKTGDHCDDLVMTLPYSEIRCWTASDIHLTVEGGGKMYEFRSPECKTAAMMMRRYVEAIQDTRTKLNSDHLMP